MEMQEHPGWACRPIAISLPRQLRLSVQSAPANFDAGQDDHSCHRSKFEAALGCVPKA